MRRKKFYMTFKNEPNPKRSDLRKKWKEKAILLTSGT